MIAEERVSHVLFPFLQMKAAKGRNGVAWRLFFSSGMIAAALMSFSGSACARDAAFLSPGGMGGKSAALEAIKVDPKPDIDVGETFVNVAKRATLFYVNQTNMPVKIEKVTISGDSSVAAEETANDCVKMGSIEPSTRCSIEVSVTPTTFGPWSVDVLMTHDGAGRIARARLFGKTGAGSGDAKSTGLSISAKDSKPIDFGSVEIGGKVVRSVLMVNDSPEAITIRGIDVIEAYNGLKRLDQGCMNDLELTPGASCPVTLLWEPRENSPVSTDLIIRHSGKIGFSVIPIRGVAKGGSIVDDSFAKNVSGSKVNAPLPPSAIDLEKAIKDRIDPVATSAFSGKQSRQAAKDSSAAAGDGELYLIGTVGTRALFLLPNGETALVKKGELFADGTARLASMTSNSAEVIIDGKQVFLKLKASPSLVSTALEQSKQNKDSSKKATSSSNDGKSK